MESTTTKLVGPVIRGMDAHLADAVITAMEIDNPTSEVIVDDQGGYIRISVAQQARLTQKTLEDELGHSFNLSQLEPALSGFAGRMKVDDSEIVWYLERTD